MCGFEPWTVSWPALATCANVSGQIWTFEPLGILGHFHLHAHFAGAGTGLDIINDAKRDTPIMARCGNFSGGLGPIMQPVISVGWA